MFVTSIIIMNRITSVYMNRTTSVLGKQTIGLEGADVTKASTDSTDAVYLERLQRQLITQYDHGLKALKT